jgi:hypothetical protein
MPTKQILYFCHIFAPCAGGVGGKSRNPAVQSLTRMSHKLRRETPREAGWDKAGAESGEGCMRTYCPNHDSSPTPSRPASRKSQQMACERCGLTPILFV